MECLAIRGWGMAQGMSQGMAPQGMAPQGMAQGMAMGLPTAPADPLGAALASLGLGGGLAPGALSSLGLDLNSLSSIPGLESLATLPGIQSALAPAPIQPGIVPRSRGKGKVMSKGSKPYGKGRPMDLPVLTSQEVQERHKEESNNIFQCFS